ncbi:hypothetical protein OQA88_10103 [Cercophora sp. LCS_1]
MVGKVVIYAGAPRSDALDWSPYLDQLGKFDDMIVCFAGLGDSASGPPAAGSDGPAPAWRTLALEKAPFHTKFSQGGFTAAGLTPGATEFFTTTSISFDKSRDAEESQELLSQFYENSIAAYQQDLAPSQVLVDDESQLSANATTSFLSTTTTSSHGETSSFLDAEPKQPLAAGGQLSDLGDIPSARYLQSIHPQTMTVNLIVGLISLSPPRAVKTRWGSTHELVEVLVGDETRAGFAVTFWLTPGTEATAVLTSIRPGDIVLLQNVALNVFTNKVYGSSLRRNLTKVHLLHASRVPGGHYTAADLSRRTTTADLHPQLAKTRRVRDWVLHFVGGGARKTKENPTQLRGAGGRSWDVMPPVDTQ